MDEIKSKLSILSFPQKEENKSITNRYIIHFKNGEYKLIVDEEVNFQIVPGINFLMFFKDISDDEMQLLEAINLDTISSFRVLEEDEEIVV